VIRLTLRDGRDGRLLARIVDRDSSALVLDYGDPETIAGASRLVRQGGFSVMWQGAVEEAAPGAPGLLRHLAMHYAASGALVFVDEPTWPRPVGSDAAMLLPDDPTDLVEDTEILTIRELGAALARVDSQRRASLPSGLWTEE